MKLLTLLPLACLALQASGAALTHRLNGFSITEHPDPVKRAKVQEVVCALKDWNRTISSHLWILTIQLLLGHLGQPVSLRSWRTNHDL